MQIKENVMKYGPDVMGLLPVTQQAMGLGEAIVHLAQAIGQATICTFYRMKSSNAENKFDNVDNMKRLMEADPGDGVELTELKNRCTKLAKERNEARDKANVASERFNHHVKGFALGVLRAIPVAGTIYSGVRLYKLLKVETPAADPSSRELPAPPVPHREEESIPNSEENSVSQAPKTYASNSLEEQLKNNPVFMKRKTAVEKGKQPVPPPVPTRSAFSLAKNNNQ